MSKPLKTAARGRVDPFIVMDVMRAAAEQEAAGATVCHLEVGQPGTSAPSKALAAARRALDGDRLGYTAALGIPELRQAIVAHYRDFYGVEIPVERVIVTTGSSGGFLVAALAAFDPGDRVAMATPSYPAYRNMLTAFGIEPVLLPTTMAERFQPTVAHLDAHLAAGRRHLDGLIVNSPTNPAGTMVTGPELQRLSAYCAECGIRLISDEIYHGVTYGAAAATAANIPGALVVNSFSKYFSMTGWRVGWMIVPDDLVRPVECLLQNLFISAPAISQIAATATFDCHDELRANVTAYAANRAMLLDRLPAAGFTDLAPVDGAFYIYADVSRLTNDSPQFCRRMLIDAGVAATPGTDFDPVNGNRFLRFSFAGSMAEVTAAADRLVAWYETTSKAP